MELVLKILSDSLYFTGPILLCTLGGLFAYKSGMINIGLEGMMLFGGFISALVIFFTGSWILGLFAAIILAILLGLLFSFFGVTKKANFIITGFAINLLATAVGKYALALLGTNDINVINDVVRERSNLDIPIIRSIPYISDIFNGQSWFTYLSFILIGVVSIIIYKTKFGTYVRVTGENEAAARSLGIKVDVIKYLAIIASAILCAFAGYNVAINQLASYTPDITAGTGFIALAAIYCGQGSPKSSALYAIIFGLSRALALNLSLRVGSIAGLLEIIPYIMIVIVLSTVAIIRERKTLYRGFINE
ncbi:ABC transporter permease [Candidatus Izemoplasma sp. B36]|uniref:ABC transporter permease n=1 Tax=Candidatus Izemoplasma sp. B36 TaxID=3242468 RepID=UPI0035586855